MHVFHVFNIVMPEREGKFARRVHLDRLPMSCGCDGDLKDWISYALEDQHDINAQSFDFREVKDNANIGTTTFYVYLRDRCYGGPEEGGWYYDAPYNVRAFTVPTRNLRRHMDRMWRFVERAYHKSDRPCVSRFAPTYKRPHYC